MYCWIRFLLAGVNENGGLSGRDVASPAIKESRSIAFEYNASALPLFSKYSSTWNTGKICLVRDFVICKQDYRRNMKKKMEKKMEAHKEVYLQHHVFQLLVLFGK